MTFSDFGIILEMIGFTFLLSTFWNNTLMIIEKRIRKISVIGWQGIGYHLRNKHPNATGGLYYDVITELLKIIGILLIIIGLVFQLDFMNQK